MNCAFSVCLPEGASKKGDTLGTLRLIGKLLKNCGQELWVKLFPRLESNGRGSDVDTDVAVCIDVETEPEEVEDGARMCDGPPVVVATNCWSHLV